MVDLKKHLAMLGMKVEDRVSGFKGTCTSVAFDLYGCIQAVVNPGVDKDGKPSDSHWFDIGRLTTTSDEPVMARPTFEWSQQEIAAGKKGPAEKPRAPKV